MNVGASSDSVKRKLADLKTRIDTHDRAVTTAKGNYPDSPLVSDYVAKWTLFQKDFADILDRSDAWTSYVLEQEADNMSTRFGILLTEFSALSTKLTLDKGQKKIEIMEDILKGNADKLKNDHLVNLKTDALPVPVANPLSVNTEDMSGVKKAVGIGAGVGVLLAFVLLLKKLFGGG